MIRFNPALHEYTLDGQHVPGVTTVLKGAGLTPDFGMVDPDVLDRAAQLGRSCDRMIELDFMGELDVDSLDDELRGYYDAWRDFLKESGCVIKEAQTLVHSPRYGYAGQLDLLAEWEGQDWLIDTKRVATVPFSTRFQTAAYAQAWQDQNQKPVRPKRFALQLKKDGARRWSLIPYTDDAHDFRVFLSALTVYNAKRMKP